MSGPRRTATRVKAGRVQKKNNWNPSERSIHAETQDEIHLERHDAGPGYRHLVTIAQLRQFVSLLPDWDELARGLDAIVLDYGDARRMGWCHDGVVAVCAWDRDLWWHESDPAFLNEHQPVLDFIDVQTTTANGNVVVQWTEDQARAFQLLHILTHELGHHHDQITTRSGRMSRGESYAENYAVNAMHTLWPAYAATFPI